MEIEDHLQGSELFDRRLLTPSPATSDDLMAQGKTCSNLTPESHGNRARRRGRHGISTMPSGEIPAYMSMGTILPPKGTLVADAFGAEKSMEKKESKAVVVNVGEEEEEEEEEEQDDDGVLRPVREGGISNSMRASSSTTSLAMDFTFLPTLRSSWSLPWSRTPSTTDTDDQDNHDGRCDPKAVSKELRAPWQFMREQETTGPRTAGAGVKMENNKDEGVDEEELPSEAEEAEAEYDTDSSISRPPSSLVAERRDDVYSFVLDMQAEAGNDARCGEEGGFRHQQQQQRHHNVPPRHCHHADRVGDGKEPLVAAAPSSPAANPHGFVDSGYSSPSLGIPKYVDANDHDTPNLPFQRSKLLGVSSRHFPHRAGALPTRKKHPPFAFPTARPPRTPPGVCDLDRQQYEDDGSQTRAHAHSRY